MSDFLSFHPLLKSVPWKCVRFFCRQKSRAHEKIDARPSVAVHVPERVVCVRGFSWRRMGEKVERRLYSRLVCREDEILRDSRSTHSHIQTRAGLRVAYYWQLRLVRVLSCNGKRVTGRRGERNLLNAAKGSNTRRDWDSLSVCRLLTERRGWRRPPQEQQSPSPLSCPALGQHLSVPIPPFD